MTIGLLFVYQIGSCCIYVVFIADNIKSIVDEVTGSDIDNRIFMCMIVLPIILINWASIATAYNVFFPIRLQNNQKNKIKPEAQNMRSSLFLLLYFDVIVYDEHFFSLGSKFEVFGAVFNNSQYCNSYFIWHHFLLYFPWSGDSCRSSIDRSTKRDTIFHWNCSIFIGIDWCCKLFNCFWQTKVYT